MRKLIKITNILAIAGAIIAAVLSFIVGDKQDGLLYLILAYTVIISSKIDNLSEAKCEIKGSDLVRLVDRESKR